jgi:hypothetical protein
MWGSKAGEHPHTLFLNNRGIALASQEDIEAGRLHDVEEVERVLGL